jgi:hypothetical protein
VPKSFTGGGACKILTKRVSESLLSYSNPLTSALYVDSLPPRSQLTVRQPDPDDLVSPQSIYPTPVQRLNIRQVERTIFSLNFR